MMENAILLASGLGTRMRPLTYSVPKPLIEVAGIPMIESVISALRRRGVKRLYVVVGYLHEQFCYLEQKYDGLELIYNPDYASVNNISSLYYARNVLEESDCFVCESDLFVQNESVLLGNYEESGYFGKMVIGPSDDWVFDIDEDGYITRVGKIGTDCYNMTGISFFKKKDGIMLSRAIEQVYREPGYEDLFWDEVVNNHLDVLRLKVFPIGGDEIIEIDTVEELVEVSNCMKKGSLHEC